MLLASCKNVCRVEKNSLFTWFSKIEIKIKSWQISSLSGLWENFCPTTYIVKKLLVVYFPLISSRFGNLLNIWESFPYFSSKQSRSQSQSVSQSGICHSGLFIIHIYLAGIKVDAKIHPINKHRRGKQHLICFVREIDKSVKKYNKKDVVF